MADYRRYQPRRSSGSLPWRRIIVFTIIVLAGIWVMRMLLSGSGSTSDSNTNQDAITLLSDNQNQNVNTADTNADVNTNSADTTDTPTPDAGLVSLDRCTQAISSYGSAKKVALTFNVAAANQNADDLLATLKDNRLAASFFVTGQFAQSNELYLQKLRDAGFGVYNRTQSNADLTALSADQITEQLSQADNSISHATDLPSKPFMRPPFGSTDDQVVQTAHDNGYCTVLWTVDAYDWQSDATAQSSRQRVLDKLAPGAIIMMSAGYDVTAQAVELLAADLKTKGFQAVSLVDLLSQD